MDAEPVALNPQSLQQSVGEQHAGNSGMFSLIFCPLSGQTDASGTSLTPALRFFERKRPGD